MAPNDNTSRTIDISQPKAYDDNLDREYLLPPHQKLDNGLSRPSSPQLSAHTLRRVPSNLSDITGDETAPYPNESNNDKPASWLSLPRKDQLLILLLVRIAEPVTQTSLTAYMFYMLQSFDRNKTDAEIAQQAGLLTAAFTGAQCLTAVMFGRLADGLLGRKRILLIGLVGTFFSIIGFGFSTSFGMALACRCIGGALNGNIGVMRTMISEIVQEKKYQPKAFLILPVTFNVGVLVGPLIGGWLESPATRFPQAFGHVQWMIDYPYALPNLVTASFLLFSFALAVLGLEETHYEHRHRPDYGLKAGQWIARSVCGLFGRRNASDYIQLDQQSADHAIELETGRRMSTGETKAPRQKLPWKRIFTKNVSLTFLTHGLLAGHVGAFNALWFTFLSTPRFNPDKPYPPDHKTQKLPFKFTGGLGLPPPTIGIAAGLIGLAGLCFQFGVYSRVIAKFGIMKTYRNALLIFIVVYTFVPYLAVVPTPSKAPEPANGPYMWAVIAALLTLQTCARCFTLPITQILVNNCTPHPSVLGTVHGIGQTVSSFARTIGPIGLSAIYGFGLNTSIVGLAWWILAIEAVMAVFVSHFIYEGSGHEIILDGEE